MVKTAAVALLLAGCYSLEDQTFPCATNGTCPSHFVCEQQLDTSYQCLDASETHQLAPGTGPKCGNGRYELAQLGSGGICGGCPGSSCDGSGLVRDATTALSWSRKPSGNLEYYAAMSFCSDRGMRVPTRAEALKIAKANYDMCAWPCGWATWTSDPPFTMGNQNYFHAYVIRSDGASAEAVAYCTNCSYHEIAPVLCVQSR